MKPNLTEDQYNEIGEAIETLAEVFKKHGLKKVELAFDIDKKDVECSIILDPTEVN